ncbi:MAG: HIT family protein [Pseudomonadales bacterium]|nr:HIT family protein [Pseudomonadales bacterium]
MNSTITRFGHPDSLVKEYEHWVVLLRPVQATLGALILACKGEAKAFADIGPAAFAELGTAVADIERSLGNLFGYQKLNYLMLMMVDPHVHFHVLPRYEDAKRYAGAEFTDPGWPGPPNIGHVNEISSTQTSELLMKLRQTFSASE